jgi:ion channel POLLUX/CASTOR
MVLIGAAIMVFLSLRAGAGRIGIAEAVWQITMRTIDTGTVAGDSGWSFRAVGFLVTMGGIFITSALIGVLASGLEQRLTELRRGRSRVLENGHTVILGWSPQVFTILNELAIANHNLSNHRKPAQGGSEIGRSACVAILADRDKLEMEEEIRIKSPDLDGTRVVCRSGNPLDPDDIQLVSPEAARAIIILSPGGAYPDMPVAKALLALTRNRGQRTHAYHIVTAIHRLVNLDLMRMIGGTETQVFLVDRLISYLIAQTCRQSGLSMVYSEFFSFEGAAIYFNEVPALVSTTYGEALYRFENSSLIGLQFHDGKSQLNPPMDTVIQPGDRVIAIAGDDDAIQLSDKSDYAIDTQAIRAGQTTTVPFDRLLILGWNRRAPLILEHLIHYLPVGSQVMIFAPYPPELMQAECVELDFHSMQLTFERGNPVDRHSLEKLAGANYTFVVILSPTDQTDIQLADAMTMIPLLHLRDIAAKNDQKLSIVSEILDVRNRELTAVTSADDVIISERLVALALTQIAENKDVVPIFIDLLTPGGSEIYLRPAKDYIVPGNPVNFYTVLAAAQQKGETAIGYRLLVEAGDAEQSFGVHLNPEKSAPIVFGEEDRVVVIATG